MYEKPNILKGRVEEERKRYSPEKKFCDEYDKVFQEGKAKENYLDFFKMDFETMRTRFPKFHLTIQAEILLQVYEEIGSEGQTLEEWVNDKWLTNFSEEFNRAFEAMTLRYPDDLLIRFRHDFPEYVRQTKEMMSSILRIESRIEEDLSLSHEVARKNVLPKVVKAFETHPRNLENLSYHEDEILNEVEEQLAGLIQN